MDNDIIVDDINSKKYDKKPYRKSKRYMIVGKSDTINKYIEK